MDYLLFAKLEKMILAEANPDAGRHPRTPAGFAAAIEAVLPNDILSSWKRYFFGKKRRSWKGIEQAARAMAIGASFDDEVLQIAPKDVLAAAANAIYSVVPQMYGPVWRDRENRENEWARIDFCALCWRFAPSGGSVTSRRPPLCEHHKPRTAEYQKHKRLITNWSEDKIASQISAGGATTPWGEAFRVARSSLATVGGPRRISPKLSPEVLDSLTHVRDYVSSFGVDTSDLQELLRCLLLDKGTPDSPDEIIRRTAESSVLLAGLLERPSDYKKMIVELAKQDPRLANLTGLDAAGVILSAEAWLSLLASPSPFHGGCRPGAGRPRKAKNFEDTSVDS